MHKYLSRLLFDLWGDFCKRFIFFKNELKRKGRGDKLKFFLISIRLLQMSKML